MTLPKISIIILLCCAYAVADYSFHYGFTSIFDDPFFEFTLGNESRPIKVLLDTNRQFSWVFNGSCNYRNAYCTNNTHAYTYHAEKTGGRETDFLFRDRFRRYRDFAGTLFEDTIKFGDIELPVKLGVITRGDTRFTFRYDGVFGLGIGDSETSVVKDIMKKLSVKQITIQEGHYYMSRPGRGYDFWSDGTITFGEYKGNLCEEFTYVDALSEGGWRFKTDIKVGKETLKDQIVGLLPGRYTEVPDKIRDKYYSEHSAKDEKNFHDIGFSIGNQTYKTTAKQFSWYYDPDKTYSARIDSSYPEYEYDFAFGSDFLQKYCVALRVDDKFEKYQIGFAQNNDSVQVVSSILLMIFGALFTRF
ncbi:unnamed protein product [Bursaphelenchus xylophilus]|uniref:(pine wood nematode) hypothetical protein n=1 Tax=Bursaphelenchus xylophilus TaxID=6326 RepID=A0A1I7RTH0_BURXY|nr:unnamed protein product [Bursaphelenchus xylophilus]CAG9122453.1 unnamed protein product [Bursaphelenchus xylophilus]